MTTYRFLRSSLATRPQHDSIIFRKGDTLTGIASVHPINPYRKLRIHTAGGTFVINEEDVEQEEAISSEADTFRQNHSW
jgi:hypothetical protein